MERLSGPPDLEWPAAWSKLVVAPPPTPVLSAQSLLADLLATVGAERHHCVVLEPEPPQFGRWPSEAQALGKLGVPLPCKPYVHQVEALDLVRSGKHVVIATGTASGKSLCYQIPILSSIMGDPQARALYVAPTKALCTDQLESWGGMLSREPIDGWLVEGELRGQRIRVARCDAETKRARRGNNASSANVVLTNSSMLNWILAGANRNWKELLGGLRFVVVDEVHTARGVVGSNLACILRRLRRLVDHYSLHRCNPQFVLCSATIGNPVELARQLIGDGAPVAAVERDTCGRGRRVFASWTPRAATHGGRRVTVVPDLVEALLDRKDGPVQTVVFHRSRPEANIVARQCKDRLERAGRDDLAGALSVYISNRLGSVKEEELARLRTGDCPAVFATSALELGVDIGALSAAIIVGMPHSRAGFRQMAGRVGRVSSDSREALILYVPRNNPLDDWFAEAEHFEQCLVRARPDDVVMDPDNSVVATQHIAAAAKELPLDLIDDARFFGELRTREAFDSLRANGWIADPGADGKYYWQARDEDPHKRINVLASRGNAQVDIKRGGGQLVGRTDNWSALWMLFPGAIYDDGVRDTYVVESLFLGPMDVGSGGSSADPPTAWVRPARPEEERSYTVAEISSDLTILDESAQSSVSGGRLAVSHGTVAVRAGLTGRYWVCERGEPGWSAAASRKLMNIRSWPQAIDREGGRVEYKELAFETKALWFEVPAHILAAMPTEDVADDVAWERQLGWIHGAEHLVCKMTAVLPGFCGDDVAGLSVYGHPQLSGPGIFLYEDCPGGSGLVDRLMEEGALERVFTAALDAVAACDCADGCPRCVLDRLCGNANDSLSKQGAEAVLRGLLDEMRHKPARRGRRP